jgi:hypothetical protein
MRTQWRNVLAFVATLVMVPFFLIGGFFVPVGFFAIFKDNFQNVVKTNPTLIFAYLAYVVCYALSALVTWQLLQSISDKRKWSFSLRAVLILMTVLALILGLGMAALNGSH